jgi:ABC-type multidrug transport system ATPase subunit
MPKSTMAQATNAPCASIEGSALLEARQISKRFGAQVVIRDLSLVFNAGEVVLLLGANGAGKSTLLRILAGLSRADRGSVSKHQDCQVGFSGHHTALYSKLSVKENLGLYASLKSEGWPDSQEMLRKTLLDWGLNDLSASPVSEVSRGTQSRASLARALMGDPRVLLLDEPSSNLDEQGTEILKAVISKKRAANCLTIVATHDLSRLRDIATRVVVMERGAVVADSLLASDGASFNKTIDRYLSGNR